MSTTRIPGEKLENVHELMGCEPMGWLDGEVALITGGASGIGRAVVDRYIAEGARVAVLDIAAQKLVELEDQYGERVVVIHGDAASESDNVQAVELACKTFGRLDILVGNAGIFDGATPLAQIPYELLSPAFDELFGINVKGYLLAARAALPELFKTEGCMIFTASYAGFHTAGGGVLYTASKHAVVGLIRQLAYELAPKVRVNGVAPGVADTMMTGVSSLGQTQMRSVLPGTESILPLKQIPSHSDHAAAYVLLASRGNARAMTGTIIHSDSGLAVRGFG